MSSESRFAAIGTVGFRGLASPHCAKMYRALSIIVISNRDWKFATLPSAAPRVTSLTGTSPYAVTRAKH